MAPKKTKKKKASSKVKKEPKPEEEESKVPLNWPEYKDPDIYTPRAKLKIALAAPITSKFCTFQMSYRPSFEVVDSVVSLFLSSIYGRDNGHSPS